jgi:hypothetical protein
MKEGILRQQVGRRAHKSAKGVGFGEMDVEACGRCGSLTGRMVLILPCSRMVEEKIQLPEPSLQTLADLEG